MRPAGGARRNGTRAKGVPLSTQQVIEWTEDGRTRTAQWRSESGTPPPRRVAIADDRMPADTAHRLVCEGTALLWRGDYQGARQMLTALTRRIDRGPRRAKERRPPAASPAEAFHRHRQAQSRRARLLGMVLVPLDTDFGVPLRRAPDVRQACAEAYGPAKGPSVVSLRELLGLIGAHEWREKGVKVRALGGDRVHPHYGVFSPVRGEYVDLVAEAPLPSHELAFDIGTGSGVLAAVLARRGIERVVATDQDARALACARENVARLGLSGRVEVVEADLFPPGRAPLVVCNPPWVPARPSSPLEYAVYDPSGRMLHGFLNGLAGHLTPGGEGWLILSDLAEHLGLRPPAELPAAFDTAGLTVLDRLDVRPVHPRAFDPTDPLHSARAAEVTSLWRLTAG
ncbi:methylase [Streptomyces rapamycinicus NRRL 5491]|uniref:Methylase n=2 Tax=Streptomyces rapamycinicus TaxID=1226757 RepID=A0A0A0NDX9_STRRN|nr:methylase [Streptomyces rapamycinicus NRRL 5491]MBB4785353.1 SAM-dependent methyltransferase [Streptomyces rapamycinicus]RLV79178.1 methylase [Streptomyces rapamycinicus NRRL 5491]